MRSKTRRKSYSREEGCYVLDILAIARTRMANERTFLAYVSTALGFLATGAAFIKLGFDTPFEGMGYVLFVIGLILPVYGLVRFIHVRDMITKRTCIDKSNRCTDMEDHDRIPLSDE